MLFENQCSKEIACTMRIRTDTV